MEKTRIKLIGIAGSLRDSSFNRGLIAAAADLAPERVHIDTFDLAEMPLYNQDRDNDDDRPAQVTALKSAIANADGMLLACPEYNYGVSGVLKNAIDWASRPAFDAPLTRKPVAVMGASLAVTGTARAQMALREVLLGCACVVYPAPDVAVGDAADKFEAGTLVDESTRERISAFLADYAGFVRMVAHARVEGTWPGEGR